VGLWETKPLAICQAAVYRRKESGLLWFALAICENFPNCIMSAIACPLSVRVNIVKYLEAKVIASAFRKELFCKPCCIASF